MKLKSGLPAKEICLYESTYNILAEAATHKKESWDDIIKRLIDKNKYLDYLIKKQQEANIEMPNPNDVNKKVFSVMLRRNKYNTSNAKINTIEDAESKIYNVNSGGKIKLKDGSIVIKGCRIQLPNILYGYSVKIKVIRDNEENNKNSSEKEESQISNLDLASSEISVSIDSSSQSELLGKVQSKQEFNQNKKVQSKLIKDNSRMYSKYDYPEHLKSINNYMKDVMIDEVKRRRMFVAERFRWKYHNVDGFRKNHNEKVMKNFIKQNGVAKYINKKEFDNINKIKNNDNLEEERKSKIIDINKQYRDLKRQKANSIDEYSFNKYDRKKVTEMTIDRIDDYTNHDIKDYIHSHKNLTNREMSIVIEKKFNVFIHFNTISSYRSKNGVEYVSEDNEMKNLTSES